MTPSSSGCRNPLGKLHILIYQDWLLELDQVNEFTRNSATKSSLLLQDFIIPRLASAIDGA